jgi:hypothetical protein
MLKLNVTQEEQLTFEIQIEGVHYDQINSHFKITVNEIDYGIPVKVGSETITVDIPPLNKIIASKLHEGDEAEAVLEVIADGRYITPWSDGITFINPVVVEAKIKRDAVKTGVSLTTKLVEKETPKVVAESIKKEDETPPIKENKSMTSSEMENLLTKTISKLGLNEESKKVPKKKKEVTLEEFKKTLTTEDVYKYINKAGSKNPRIQEIVYEQAVNEAGNNKPINVLKQVIKVMKKNRS